MLIEKSLIPFSILIFFVTGSNEISASIVAITNPLFESYLRLAGAGDPTGVSSVATTRVLKIILYVIVSSVFTSRQRVEMSLGIVK